MNMMMMLMSMTFILSTATMVVTSSMSTALQAHRRLNEALIRRVVVRIALLWVGIIVHVALLGVALVVLGMRFDSKRGRLLLLLLLLMARHVQICQAVYGTVDVGHVCTIDRVDNRPVNNGGGGRRLVATTARGHGSDDGWLTAAVVVRDDRVLLENGLGRQVGEELVVGIVFDDLSCERVDVLPLDDALRHNLSDLVDLLLLLMTPYDLGTVGAYLFRHALVHFHGADAGHAGRAVTVQATVACGLVRVRVRIVVLVTDAAVEKLLLLLLLLLMMMMVVMVTVAAAARRH